MLLLNRVLTVSPGKPGSHQGKGWETVTAAAIEALVARGGPLVAVLWGRQAQSLAPHARRVPRVESAHPSPLSAHSGFFGSRPFSRANSLLVEAGRRPSTGGWHDRPATEPRVWTRYVAVGDSFTEGMSDPDPEIPDRYVGWADRLAVDLARYASDAGHQFGYANLAVRGRLLADIVGPQLDAALALEPDLVSIVGGGNDILRPSADVDALAGKLEDAVVRIRDDRGRRPHGHAVRPGRRAAGASHPRPGRGLRRPGLGHRPAARRPGSRPVEPGRPPRLADVGRRPHPHDRRGPSAGRPRGPLDARPRHRRVGLAYSAAGRGAGRRAERPWRATPAGPASTSRPGSSAGCAASPPATCSPPSAPRSPRSNGRTRDGPLRAVRHRRAAHRRGARDPRHRPRLRRQGAAAPRRDVVRRGPGPRPRPREAARRTRHPRDAPRGVRLRGNRRRRLRAGLPGDGGRRLRPPLARLGAGLAGDVRDPRLRQRGAEAGVAPGHGRGREAGLLRPHRAGRRLQPREYAHGRQARRLR